MNQYAKFVVAWLAISALHALAAQVTIDLRPPAAPSRRATSVAQPREGAVRLARLAAGAADTGPLSVGDELSFILFDGETHDLSLLEQTESPLGGTVFLAATEPGEPLSSVVLQTDAGLCVEMPAGGNRVFSIVSSQDHVAVFEYDTAAGEIAPCETVEPDIQYGANAQQHTRDAADEDQPEGTIDIMVAFDENATAWANAFGGGTTNFATIAVQKMNVGLANSGLGAEFRFRLVCVLVVPANGAEEFPGSQSRMFNGVLDAAQGGSGPWRRIRAMRKTCGADIVTTLIDTGSAFGVTGLGFALRTTDIASFSEHPYNVCAVRAVAAGHTMTHECGHNLGAGHATAVKADRISPGPQLHSYSAGHFFTGTNGIAYHSIMAYNWDGFGNHYYEAPLFSTPLRTWRGTAAGDDSHDNAQTIRQTWAEASQWRGRKTPASYDVRFSPGDGTDFADSIAVTLTPGKAGLPIRYTLDDTDPTLESTPYTGPITITNATTIRAMVVTDGVPGPIYRAYYGPDRVAIALDAPGTRWINEPGNPWVVQTDKAYKGGSAVRSAMLSEDFSGSLRLETIVTGPTNITFRYQKHFAEGSYLQVLSAPVGSPNDVSQLFLDDEYGSSSDWRLAEFAVPAGERYVTFTYYQGDTYYIDGYNEYVFNGVWLDTVCFGELSRPPSISPETTSIERTALTFTEPLQITLSPPEGVDGILLYSTDGSPPDKENGFVYSGPFTIADSTRVRAVFVETAKEASVEVDALYLSRRTAPPGEWTPNPVNILAATNAPYARLVAFMLYNLDGDDPDCEVFTPLAYSDFFLDWCASNGVFLVVCDPVMYPESQNAEDWFWELHYKWTQSDVGVAQVPGIYFALPSDILTPIASGVAIVNQDSPFSIGSVPYDGTMDSLISGFKSVLDMTPEPPTCGDLCDGLYWSVEESRLTISGHGDMPEWGPTDMVSRPYLGYANDITEIIVAEGVTSVSPGAFQGFSNLVMAILPDSTDAIGENAFADCPNLEMIYMPSAFFSVIDMLGLPDTCGVINTDIYYFVKRLYNLCLGREPDFNGGLYWATLLATGKRNGVSVAYGFCMSAEMKRRNLSDTEYVGILYNALMGRQPDNGGMAHWVDLLAKGISRVGVFRGFAESAEFTRICNSYGITRGNIDQKVLENRDKNRGVTFFAARLYTKALNRDYDVNGLNHWCGKILSSPNKKSAAIQAAVGFLKSKEFKNRKLSNAAFVNVLYQTFLGRDPDAGGRAHWVGKLNGGMSRDAVMAGFYNSAEFKKIMAGYGIR